MENENLNEAETPALQQGAVSRSFASFDITSLKDKRSCNKCGQLIGKFTLEGLNENNEKTYEDIELRCDCK